MDNLSWRLYHNPGSGNGYSQGLLQLYYFSVFVVANRAKFSPSRFAVNYFLTLVIPCVDVEWRESSAAAAAPCSCYHPYQQDPFNHPSSKLTDSAMTQFHTRECNLSVQMIENILLVKSQPNSQQYSYNYGLPKTPDPRRSTIEMNVLRMCAESFIFHCVLSFGIIASNQPSSVNWEAPSDRGLIMPSEKFN